MKTRYIDIYVDRVYSEGAMFLVDSMRPEPCTDAEDFLSCCDKVGDLYIGEREEPNIPTQIRHLDLMRALRTGQSTQDLHYEHESELHGNGAGRESNPEPLANGYRYMYVQMIFIVELIR